MKFLLLLLFHVVNARHFHTTKHPNKYKIINGHPYINYYTFYNGYGNFHRMNENDCFDYDYNFSNVMICCDFRIINEVKITINFNSNFDNSKMYRRLLNSLRNTPTDYSKFENIYNQTYLLNFITSNMFTADEDNLIEEFKYIDEIKNYKIIRQHHHCQKSKFKLIQEENDNNFLKFIGYLILIVLFCKLAGECIKQINKN